MQAEASLRGTVAADAEEDANRNLRKKGMMRKKNGAGGMKMKKRRDMKNKAF